MCSGAFGLYKFVGGYFILLFFMVGGVSLYVVVRCLRVVYLLGYLHSLSVMRLVPLRVLLLVCVSFCFCFVYLVFEYAKV